MNNKKQKIVLVRVNELYKVKSLTNRMEPTVGSILSDGEVKKLLDGKAEVQIIDG